MGIKKEIIDKVIKEFKKAIRSRVNKKRITENDIWIIENTVAITLKELKIKEK